MADILITDWIEEYEALTESEIHTYASEQEHNYEVIMALYSFFEEPHKTKTDNFIAKVCQQFFSFYRTGEPHLRQFVLQYIPVLVCLHLADPKDFPSIRTLLVSIYNLEVVDNKGQPHVVSFRVPSIAQSSIYHDSTMLEPAFIAENSLRRWEECNSKLVSWGPLPQVENLNAQNRQRVVAALIFLYNQQISKVVTQGLEYSVKVISRLVGQGFNMSSSNYSRGSMDSDSFNDFTKVQRLVVSSPLLLELLHAVYHMLERGTSGASRALHDVTQRALYESYTDVLLVAHAVRNLLHRSPTAKLSIQQPHIISKSMITNASFRTKKLPDDIPIQVDEASTEGALGSITEEQEDTEKGRTRSGSSALKHLPKLPGLSKKPKTSKSSPTPQRNSLGNDSLEMHVTGSDREQEVSLVSGAFGDSINSDDVPQPVHVSAV